MRIISVRVTNWLYREHEIFVCVNARSHCYTRSILVRLYANTITLKSADLLRAVMDINRETDRQERSDGQTDGRKV
jgi:N-formylglutamate amidohydrolase